MAIGRTTSSARLGCDTEGYLETVIHEGWQETSVCEAYTMNPLNTTQMA